MNNILSSLIQLTVSEYQNIIFYEDKKFYFILKTFFSGKDESVEGNIYDSLMIVNY